jgi:flagellar motor protein MotB
MKAILSEGFSSILLGVLLVNSLNKIERKSDEEIQQTKDLVRNGITQYEEKKESLYLELSREFETDLPRWGADLDKSSLSIRFTIVDETSPRVMFRAGSTYPTDYYRDLIRDFCPRYYGVLKKHSKEKFIEEIKVEGHTSSDWKGGAGGEKSYYSNLELSQGRSSSILSLCLSSVQDNGAVKFSDSDFSIFRGKMTANGYSSSRIITNEDGSENFSRSRRVEFRIVTSADNQLQEISRSINDQTK